MLTPFGILIPLGTLGRLGALGSFGTFGTFGIFGIFGTFGALGAFGAFTFDKASSPAATFGLCCCLTDGGDAEKFSLSGGIGFSILCLQSRHIKWKSSRSACSLVMP